MKDSEFNVLLYSDGSHQAFSAAVYTATFFKNMPNMHLTVVQVQDEGSNEQDYSWIDTWPVSPTSEWMKRVVDGSDEETKKHYHKILMKTNEIFTEREVDISHHVLSSKTSISETVDALLEYVSQNSFKLIIMGTRGLTAIKGLVFGCLAHNVLNRSPIPVLLVKKLPQTFIDDYLSETID